MGLKRNFLFSSILTVSNYIFPFIVYPYVARTLGVNNIGICNFVDSIINYAVIVSSMGISIVGTRSIAKVKDDPGKLNETFSSLFVLTLSFTVLASIILLVASCIVTELQQYKSMMLIGQIKLWGNLFLIEWLFKGLEDFKYITVRSILVKIGYAISVFVFIHTPSDYGIYFFLLCLSVAVNAVINCYRAAGSIRFQISAYDLRLYLSPFLILGLYLFIGSFYTTFNVIYLGLEWNDWEVGLYTTATKVITIILALYTSYTTVALPRASALISSGKDDEFKELIKKSIHGLLLFSIPIVFFLLVFHKNCIVLFAGSEYIDASMPFLIIIPLIFIIGYEQILVVQILTPLSSDKVIMMNSIIGAAVGILCNLFLVPKYAAIGSSFSWLLAECAILVWAQIMVTRYTKLLFPLKLFLIYLISYLPFLFLSWIIIYITDNSLIQIIVAAASLIVYTVVLQKTWLNNPIFDTLYVFVKSKITKK